MATTVMREIKQKNNAVQKKAWAHTEIDLIIYNYIMETQAMKNSELEYSTSDC